MSKVIQQSLNHSGITPSLRLTTNFNFYIEFFVVLRSFAFNLNVQVDLFIRKTTHSLERTMYLLYELSI